MWRLGWVAANDGNVTARISEDRYLATPTGISKSFIRPEMLIVIDGQGRVIKAAKGFRPSSEIKMHLRCYADRPDVGGVVHAHPPAATGFAVAGIPMDRYTMVEAVISLGSVPICPFATPSTDEVPDSIAPFIKEHDAVLLANHGALTLGASVLQAYYFMESLELWAKISINARILGGEREMSREHAERLIGMRAQFGLKGRHPGFKRYSEL
jgi:L-fuculose-phosphate aldolase